MADGVTAMYQLPIGLTFRSSLFTVIAELCFWGAKTPKTAKVSDRKRERKQRINADAISCYFEMEIILSWLLRCHTDLSLASHVCKAIYHDITALQIPYMRVIHHLFQLLPGNKSV